MEPSFKNVRSQGYPLKRPLYFYLSNKSNESAREFIKFAMSDKGQAVVNQTGVVGRNISPATEKPVTSRDNVIETKYRELIQGTNQDQPWNLRFSEGSNYRLSESSVGDFNALRKYLSNPNGRNSQVVLIGFSDSVGDDWKNQKLSKNRADVVAAKLRDWGVSNIRTAGFGEAMPIGDNNTPQGRNTNRRVEVLSLIHI